MGLDTSTNTSSSSKGGFDIIEDNIIQPNEPYLHGYSKEEIEQGYIPLQMINDKIKNKEKISLAEGQSILINTILDLYKQYQLDFLFLKNRVSGSLKTKHIPSKETPGEKTIVRRPNDEAIAHYRSTILYKIIEQAKKGKITTEMIQYLKNAYHSLTGNPQTTNNLVSLFDTNHHATIADKSSVKNLLKLIRLWDPNFAEKKNRRPQGSNHTTKFVAGKLELDHQGIEIERGTPSKHVSKGGQFHLEGEATDTGALFDKKEIITQAINTIYKKDPTKKISFDDLKNKKTLNHGEDNELYDMVVGYNHPISGGGDIGADLMFIYISRIDGVDRDKTIVLYNGPAKATYVIDGLINKDDFYDQTVIGIYDQISSMRKDAKRFLMTKSEIPGEEWSTRIIDEILNPNTDEIITNQDRDIMDYIKIILLDIKENNPILFEQIRDQKIYNKAAHEFNKILQEESSYIYEKYLPTTDYSLFLELFKDPSFTNYKMHNNYFEYILDGKSLMPLETYKERIGTNLGDGDYQQGIQKLKNMKSEEYSQKAKEYNKDINHKKYFIFEAGSYCMNYLQSQSNEFMRK